MLFTEKQKEAAPLTVGTAFNPFNEYQIHSPIIMFICPFHKNCFFNWWWRTSTHPFADGDSFFGQGLGVGHVVLHNGLEQFVLVLSIERRLQMERRDIIIIIIHRMSTDWHLFFFYSWKQSVIVSHLRDPAIIHLVFFLAICALSTSLVNRPDLERLFFLMNKDEEGKKLKKNSTW